MVLLSLLAAMTPGVTDIIRTSQSLSICQDVPDTKLHIFDWGRRQDDGLANKLEESPSEAPVSTCIRANNYMVKTCGRNGFHSQVKATLSRLC
ncbi:hypothetical protein U0070_009928 [Myodes glareolus]|uniref:Uncharacterized protein n=1 Tax=Myodes glareolus TaxID=447135 RepID=A0AAW0JHT6_MYOGA